MELLGAQKRAKVDAEEERKYRGKTRETENPEKGKRAQKTGSQMKEAEKCTPVLCTICAHFPRLLIVLCIFRCIPSLFSFVSSYDIETGMFQ